MHFGQGALIGVLRSVMANVGLRGPVASTMFAVVRLTNDQILENATGVGAPPLTWPRPELALDLLHKAVYAFGTGVIADSLAARSTLAPDNVTPLRVQAVNRTSDPLLAPPLSDD
jgi:hypothetical protein